MGRPIQWIRMVGRPLSVHAEQESGDSQISRGNFHALELNENMRLCPQRVWAANFIPDCGLVFAI
jgi:hypothetical protein